MSDADQRRRRAVVDMMQEQDLEALVCALPSNVVLLTRYWPVVGDSVAVLRCDGHLTLIAPQSEREFIDASAVDDVRFVKGGGLEKMMGPLEKIGPTMSEAFERLGITGGRIGVEFGPFSEPASYVESVRFGCSMRELIIGAIAAAEVVPVDRYLARLRAVKTPSEVERIALTVLHASDAFVAGARALRTGISEAEAASAFQTVFDSTAEADERVARSGGRFFVTVGTRSAQAARPFQHTAAHAIATGDLVLVHCNVACNGFWTDLTRTYVVGQPSEQIVRMQEAVTAAREAALGAIAPGVRACDVDAAARGVIDDFGFGQAFPHPTGHGVGFLATDHNAPPRLHPQSDEALEAGMVFNVEPAVYLDAVGGLRHCDMVAVTEAGVRLLSDVQPPTPWS